VFSPIRANCYNNILLYVTELLSRSTSSFEFTVNRLFMKLFRTASPVIVPCCQLGFNFLPVRSQLDIRTANYLQTLIASENSLTLVIKKALFARFYNDTITCQFLYAIGLPDSLTYTDILLSLYVINVSVPFGEINLNTIQPYLNRRSCDYIIFNKFIFLTHSAHEHQTNFLFRITQFYKSVEHLSI